MTQHRYPAGALIADYLRSAVGAAVTVLPLLLLEVLPFLEVLLAVLALVFLVYGLRTAVRQRTVIELDGSGIRSSGLLGAAIPWHELQDVNLRYFSTRRDRRNGWMQLRVAGRQGTLRIDSSLDGFEHLAREVLREARARELPLGEPTLANMQAFWPERRADGHA